MPLLVLSILWLIGIYLGSKVLLPSWILIVSVLPLILLPFIKQKRMLVLTAAGILVFACGCLLGSSNNNEPYKTSLAFYNDKGGITLTGMIDTEPDIRDRSIEFKLRVSSIVTGDSNNVISGRALIKTARTFDYHYGDIVSITGTAESPKSFGDFDYKEYLSRDDVYTIFSYPSIEIVDRDKGNPVLSAIFAFRNRLYSSLSKALPEPQCSLAQGMLLGTTGSIPTSLKQNFNNTGTTHLLAISGLNLSIILYVLLSIGIWIFGKNHAIYIWLALIMIWFYSMLTGMKPPIVRSAVMGSMFLLAEALGRQQNSGVMLLFTAAVMAGLNVTVLKDPSFQLSFVSMAGLIYIYPEFKSRLIDNQNKITGSQYGRNFRRFVMENTLVTISAVIATWPLVAYYFSIFSLTSIPATLLALPVMPYIIFTCAITAVIGIFLPLLAQIAGWVAWLFLSYFLVVINTFAIFPVSWIKIDHIPGWTIVCYYGILAAALLYIHNGFNIKNIIASSGQLIVKLYNCISGFIIRTPRKYIALPLTIIAILLEIAIISLPDDMLHVCILNVGQGDAILVQTHNKTILIDGGPSPQSIKTGLSKKMPFWNRTIDLILITQPQSDHITGLLEVLKCYDVKAIMEADIPYKSTIYSQLLNQIRENKIPYSQIHSGEILYIDNDISLDILYPPLFINTKDSVNDNSLVLRLNYNNRHFLFTGDIAQNTEYFLMSQRNELKSDVLKVAHHGSRTSSSPEFLRAVQMKAAVISAGASNIFGHPHQETLNRLSGYLDKSNILVTSQCGTVEFITDGDSIWVKTEY
jgi:competence protein ComEC